VLNLAVMLQDAARAVPDRDAVVLGQSRLTYAQVDAAASQVAGWLAEQEVGPGDRVALTCPNLPFFPIVYYGILKTGATVVPLNVLLKEREIAYHLADSGARVYFCFEGTHELPMGTAGYGAFEQTDGCEHFVMITADPTAASPIEGTKTLGSVMHGGSPAFSTVPTRETDVAVILYTSGTTGQPKGAQLSHSNMVQNAQLGPKVFGWHDGDVHLLALPLFHSFGQTVDMNMGFYTQSTLVLMPRFEPGAALGLMESEGVTFFAGVPTMYWAMLNHPGAGDHDLSKIADRLRLAVSGGSPMPVEVLRKFGETFRVKILEGYGLSETSPVATFNHVDRETRPGTVGQAVWGVQVKIVDLQGNVAGADEPGEVLIKGHNIMIGYHDRPEATAESIDADGWFRSGDIGTLDKDGFLTIVDRAKDMIIRGGFNVYPREVEEVLVTHPAVSLVAVVGVPHDEHGEEVKAYVIKAADADVTEDELIAWSKDQMASFKYPRIVEFRDTLPMTATGKILKRELV
jgi:long-chain acyl-CoA synthetase